MTLEKLAQKYDMTRIKTTPHTTEPNYASPILNEKTAK